MCFISFLRLGQICMVVSIYVTPDSPNKWLRYSMVIKINMCFYHVVMINSLVDESRKGFKNKNLFCDPPAITPILWFYKRGGVQWTNKTRVSERLQGGRKKVHKGTLSTRLKGLWLRPCLKPCYTFHWCHVTKIPFPVYPQAIRATCFMWLFQLWVRGSVHYYWPHTREICLVASLCPSVCPASWGYLFGVQC